MNAVEMKDVGMRFDNGVEALDGFSLSLSAGERVGLLGPSGCGKSTALRLLSGLNKPTRGTITRPVDQLAFVFQDPTLLPWATVFENVAKPLRLSGKADIDKAVEDVLRRVELLEFSQSYPRELSGGMAMRVSIARALVTRPSLMLMDEPFAALDEQTRFRLNDILLEQQERDRFTLLFVTHSVFESVYVSDRVLVMRDRPGRVVDEIKTAPGHVRNSDFRLSEDFINLCRTVSKSLEGG